MPSIRDVLIVGLAIAIAAFGITACMFTGGTFLWFVSHLFGSNVGYMSSVGSFTASAIFIVVVGYIFGDK